MRNLLGVLALLVPPPRCLPHYLVEQSLGCPVLQQTPAVLGEHRRVEAALHQVHVQEPAKQETVLQLLAEGPLAGHRVEGDAQ